MKKCSKCLEIKDFSDFRKDRQKKDGLHPHCKDCIALKAKEYYSNNKSKLLSRSKEYSLKNKETRKIKRKEYHLKNKEMVNAKGRQYYKENKDKYQEYYRNNKELVNKRNVKYRVNRYKNDINFKLVSLLRGRLTDAIRGNFKNGSAIEDLGCSIEEFKLYIESKFQEGMTWDNHGLYGWHIDHIIPLSSFDLTDNEQLKKAVHYTNLQPLWAEDNLKKGNRVLTTYNDNTTTPIVSSGTTNEAVNEVCQILTSEVDHV